MSLRKAEYDFISVPNFSSIARGPGGAGALGTFQIRNVRNGRNYNYNLVMGGAGGGLGGEWIGFGILPIDREGIIYYGPNNTSPSLAPEDFLGECMAFLMTGGLIFGGAMAYLYFGLPIGAASVVNNPDRINGQFLVFPRAKAIGVFLSTYLTLQAGGGSFVLVGHVGRR